jgi:phage protein D
MSNDDNPLYFAPAFRIKVAGRALEPEQERAVTELTVTHELNTSDYFSVTLASPYPELPWTHGGDAALFQPGVGVSIEMGYVDDLHLMLSGEVTGLTPNFPADGASTLRVEGHSRLHRLDGARQTQTFLQQTDSDIAAKIAGQVGLSAKIDKTDLRYPYVIQNNQTNLEFLRERANGIHFELLVEDRTLVFRKPKLASTAVLTLKWGEGLLRFQPNLNSLQPLTEVTVSGYDVKTNKTFVGRAGSGAEEKIMGGKSGAKLAGAAFGGRAATVVDREPTSRDEAEQYAKAVFNARMMELITGSGASIGSPLLRAGIVVDIEGLGESFSGSYYVVRATHTMGAGGYETEFSVKRNAVT